MGAVTNRRRPHNHESIQIASPGKFADHPLPRRQLSRLLPLPPAKSGESIPESGDGGILADETIVALDDKHLVAYMSIYIEGGQVFASTVVRYHNKLGVVYFNLIRPFHVLVVKNLFKQMMRERGF